MKIALLGYGKMGKALESAAKSKGDEIKVIIDNIESWATNKPLLSSCDVAIDFSQPEAAFDNIINCFEMQIPVVSGTTGWHNRLSEINETCLKLNGSLLYASNFSIGVTIFREINKKLAVLMNDYPEYTSEILEIHHTQKLDAPSGTAILLANELIECNNNFDNWSLGERKNKSLLINSVREGNIPGTHKISWKSNIDCIEITHEAYNREGFVKGALLAAAWIIGKKGIYTISDLLKI